MVFNIGNQQGNISNVAGNQVNYGDQYANVVAPPDILAAVRQVAGHLDDLPLSPSQRVEAKKDLEMLDQEMTAGKATQEHVSHRLERLLHIARSAGAVITAGSNLGTAITKIANWIGPIGVSLIRYLT